MVEACDVYYTLPTFDQDLSIHSAVILQLFHIVSTIISKLFQETERITGTHYCHTSSAFVISIWAPIYMAINFAVEFFIPFTLIVHNYARIGVTLFKSLRENEHLQEGMSIQ